MARSHGGESRCAPKAARLRLEQLGLFKRLRTNGRGSKRRNSKMGCPGKWKRRPTPVVCPSCSILSTQMSTLWEVARRSMRNTTQSKKRSECIQRHFGPGWFNNTNVPKELVLDSVTGSHQDSPPLLGPRGGGPGAARSGNPEAPADQCRSFIRRPSQRQGLASARRSRIP